MLKLRIILLFNNKISVVIKGIRDEGKHIKRSNFQHIQGRGSEIAEMSDDDSFPDYLSRCQEQLKKALPSYIHLQTMLFRMREEIIQDEQKAEAQGKPLLDYF